MMKIIMIIFRKKCTVHTIIQSEYWDKCRCRVDLSLLTILSITDMIGMLQVEFLIPQMQKKIFIEMHRPTRIRSESMVATEDYSFEFG